jgi:hypothetical protein
MCLWIRYKKKKYEENFFFPVGSGKLGLEDPDQVTLD